MFLYISIYDSAAAAAVTTAAAVLLMGLGCRHVRGLSNPESLAQIAVAVLGSEQVRRVQ
jgi:hypothetical protein